jgi:hypothetical protein
MSTRRDKPKAADAAARETAGDDVAGEGLGDDPFAHDPVFQALYAPSAAAARAPAPAPAHPNKGRTKERRPLKEGQDWRLVTFSFYEDDVERLDALLNQARKLGHRKVSRSQIVRLALRQVDLSKLPDVI